MEILFPPASNHSANPTQPHGISSRPRIPNSRGPRPARIEAMARANFLEGEGAICWKWRAVVDSLGMCWCAKCDIIAWQPRAGNDNRSPMSNRACGERLDCARRGWQGLHLFLMRKQKGGDSMENFDFAALYDFLQVVLCMILSFMGGRHSGKQATRRKEKSRPRSKVKRLKTKKSEK